MRLVANSPALDFVNSQSGPAKGQPDDDAVGSYVELLAWAEYSGVLLREEAERLSEMAASRAETCDAVFSRAIGLRAQLRALFEAIAEDRPGPEAAVEALAAAERDAIGRAVLIPRGSTFDWSWPDVEDPARPLWIVVHSAVELLRTGPLDRLKQCGGCRFLFLDETKNKSRRWCAMSDCGTASKMRSYVARRARKRAAERAGRLPAP
jgi:predicted RNA-binding Zn ribbon-like protein